MSIEALNQSREAARFTLKGGVKLFNFWTPTRPLVCSEKVFVSIKTKDNLLFWVLMPGPPKYQIVGGTWYVSWDVFTLIQMFRSSMVVHFTFLEKLFIIGGKMVFVIPHHTSSSFVYRKNHDKCISF